MAPSRFLTGKLCLGLALAIVAAVSLSKARAETPVDETSIWGNSSVPVRTADPESKQVEVGVKFLATSDGVITGLRFYKDQSNIGEHIGSLWSRDGVLLGRAIFTNESTSGWQDVRFPTPVSITAWSTYVASYNAPSGRYSSDEGYFANQVAGAGVRTIVDGSDGPTSVFRYGPAAFPTESFQATNYWVDVMFKSTAPAVWVPAQVNAVTLGGSSGADVQSNVTSPIASDPIVVSEPRRRRRSTASTVPSDPVVAAPVTPGVDPVVAVPLGGSPTPVVSPTVPADTAAPAVPALPVPVVVVPGVVGGFPDSLSSGVPVGVVLRASGDVTVSVPGTVLDGLDISGTVSINVSNVTIRRSRIRGSGFALVWIKAGVTGVRVEDSTLDGLGSSEGSMGIWGPATSLRNDIRGVENGIAPDSGSLVQDNFVHDLQAPGAPHYDGIQIDGGISNVTIRHNTVLNNHDQTAAVMIDNYFGPISNIVVDGNLLGGGGYTAYSDGQFSGGSISGVSFTNNRFRRGFWGYSSVRNNTVSASGNVDDTTGTPVGF